MKEVLIILSCLVFWQVLSAQTFSEWFRQNSTQLKYLSEQIAALQEYILTVNNGYAMAKDGLGTIGTIVEVDVEIHSGYFNYLQKISQAVQGDARIPAIRQYLEEMPLIARAISAEGALQPKGAVDWKTFAPVLAERIVESADEDELWLNAVLEDDNLGLNDEERESIIACIYQEVGLKNERALHLLAELQANGIKPRL